LAILFPQWLSWRGKEYSLFDKGEERLLKKAENRIGGHSTRMKPMGERFRIFSISLALCFVLLAHGVGDTGVISTDRLEITDVTPRAFSVVWATSEPATCGLNVFLDAEGNTP